MAADFALTGIVRIILALLASTGVLYFMRSRLQARLTPIQYAIIGLTVITAALHMLSGARDYLLYLNGVGYMILLLVLYFMPLGPLAAYRRWIYGILSAYTLITIIGYFIVHPTALTDFSDTLGLGTKFVELLLLIALAVDYWRGGQPVTPIITEAPIVEVLHSHQFPEDVPALTVEGLKYSYPDKPNVLENVNLSVPQKARVGLIGPNGAGKTTFFMSLVGIQRPAGGTITLFGKPLKHRDFRPEIGMVFQKSDDQLFSPSVRDDIAFGPENLGLSPDAVTERVEAALATTGTAKLADRPPHHLSGGEKRMVSIAGVMAMEPQLVIYDEPSANLDIRSRRRLIEFLQQADHAYIIASHDLEFLLEVCERVILLDEGHIIADGPPNEVMNDVDLMAAHGLERPHSLTPHVNS
ncbi:MAG: ABC transporter ATP-binding protein [Chloroflexota bacterium]